jgi:hypothetical protein
LFVESTTTGSVSRSTAPRGGALHHRPGGNRPTGQAISRGYPLAHWLWPARRHRPSCAARWRATAPKTTGKRPDLPARSPLPNYLFQFSPQTVSSDTLDPHMQNLIFDTKREKESRRKNVRPPAVCRSRRPSARQLLRAPWHGTTACLRRAGQGGGGGGRGGPAAP